MAVTLEKPTKATELDILHEAAAALRKHDEALAALRASEAHVKSLCRAYDRAGGVWGFQPHHLRRACEARGLL